MYSDDRWDFVGPGLFLDIPKEGYAQFGLDVYGLKVQRVGSTWQVCVKARSRSEFLVAFLYAESWEAAYRKIGEAFANGKVSFTADKYPPRKKPGPNGLF